MAAHPPYPGEEEKSSIHGEQVSQKRKKKHVYNQITLGIWMVHYPFYLIPEVFYIIRMWRLICDLNRLCQGGNLEFQGALLDVSAAKPY